MQKYLKKSKENMVLANSRKKRKKNKKTERNLSVFYFNLIKLDNFILYDKDKVHIFNNVRLCVAHVNIQGYQLILHHDLIKENDYENAEYLEKVG